MVNVGQAGLKMTGEVERHLLRPMIDCRTLVPDMERQIGLVKRVGGGRGTLNRCDLGRKEAVCNVLYIQSRRT